MLRRRKLFTALIAAVVSHSPRHGREVSPMATMQRRPCVLALASSTSIDGVNDTRSESLLAPTEN
jgi:hypothetical protein